ncbi:hypothetical protein ASG40_18775 [Methylobacterium sp. Leaf399]|uniref:hypothetical protein n=1 Tax=unclassified Methylobacterium TaxID=2615210 RepID=UPI0006F8ACA7|nr:MULTISPECIES: hypothetical protein [unclassified Methylobacterium]KQP59092.1 hypothetical protein ASF39_16620 [Methylobacterium sp. Leaf108]KQT15362.1 hypothetical protein ASG40_18775 [Methylobacterium sp. Leaf399]KQT78646.1 hypothetical protein ASG59_05485 [Methylobacterium sp. Leaf466]
MNSFAAAGLPLAAALACILAATLGGLDQNSALPPGLAPYAYGFFLDRYPLFAVAIVYGLARLIAAATAPGPAGFPRRAAGLAVGAATLLALSLYPTFGGLILRGAFGSGSMAFLNQQPMGMAYALGSALGAALFGTAMGLGVIAMTARRVSLRRFARRTLPAALAAFLALWFAFAVLGLAHAAGLGPWPRRALTAGDALIAAGLVVVAFLPHALLVAWRTGAEEVRPAGVVT